MFVFFVVEIGGEGLKKEGRVSKRERERKRRREKKKRFFFSLLLLLALLSFEMEEESDLRVLQKRNGGEPNPLLRKLISSFPVPHSNPERQKTSDPCP